MTQIFVHSMIFAVGQRCARHDEKEMEDRGCLMSMVWFFPSLDLPVSPSDFDKERTVIAARRRKCVCFRRSCIHSCQLPLETPAVGSSRGEPSRCFPILLFRDEIGQDVSY